MEPVSKVNPTDEAPPLDDKEDEDMLAACINIGMQQNNRFPNFDNFEFLVDSAIVVVIIN